MKYIIYILFLSCIGLSATAQLPSSTFPSRIFNGNTKAQWIILDSPVVNPILDTFNARYPGTQLVRIQGGDTAFWFGAGGHLWFRSLLSRDTVSLSNRINLKLNISDTIGKWLAQSTRLVDTMYRVNDSTIGYTIKGNPYTFQILGRSSGGGGGGTGTVTSVALSMPSAFSVSGSPITTNGTFNVSGAGTTSQYIRGNGTLATTDTGMIPNFYLKVRGLLTGTSPVTFNQTTGAIGINNANTTGTKGAASFTSAFSDNGSGLIDLANIVSTGSCTNCSVTYNAKGQATAYSSGIAPSGSSVDTIFRTPGVDSIYYTINSVQYAIKDSAGPTVTASNGLQKVVNDIRLGAASGPGAPLIYDSYIDAGSFQLNISGANGSNAVLSSSNSSGGYGLEGASSSASGAGIHAVNTSGGIGLSAEVLAGKALYLTAISGIPLYAVGQPSNANGNSVMAEFHRQTSGTATSGIAQSFDYWSQLSNGTNDTIARVAITTTTATAGSQSGAYDIWLKNNGGSLSRVSRITSSGQQVWDKYPGFTAQADTTTYKPVAIDASGNVVKMIGWAGGGGGSASLTATQVGFGGPSNTLTGEAELNYITATNTLTADTMRQIINRNDTLYSRYKVIVNPTGESYAQVDGAQELGPGLFIRQQITNDGRDVNEHGVIDRTEFARAGKAYASFDAQPVITGVNFDHYSAFQARPDINITGTMSNAYILYSRPLLTGSGTITNLYHSGVPIDYTNNGTITNEYGSYIRTLKGVNRWAYYAVADKSFFGGNVGIGTDGPTYPLTLNKNGVPLIGSWVNVAQISNAAGTAGIDLGYDNSTNDGIITSQGASSGFQFWTHNGSSFGLRGVFASSGNFGLGTGSPGRLLTLNNSIIPTFGFSRSDVEKALIGVSDAADHGVTGSAANDWFLRIVSGQKMLFSTDEGATANLVINASGNTLINRASDNSTGAKLQVNGAITTVTDSAGSPINMAWIDSDGKIRKAAAPGGSATTIYNGDGTLAGPRLVSTGGNTLTVSGANNSDTVMIINNTGTTGLGLHVFGTALGVNIVSSAGAALQGFGSTRGAIITGDTDEGLLVKSNAVRGARIQTVPSSTNTVVEVLQLERGSSGGPGATGIGEYISFLNKTSTNSSDVSNTIVSKFTDGTTATRTSQFAITGVNNASAVTLMTLDGNGNATFGTTNSIVGTATNNSAVSGNIGEEINSTVSTYTNYTTTATYQNVTSITLTAGDWDITAQGTLSSNGATITAANDAIFVISTTTASASGATEGKNISYIPQAALLGTSHESTSIVPFRVSLSGTTTYYLNTQASFTVGNPQFTGTIRARRAR